MTDESDEFLPTRLSLLGRLKDWGDQQSWQEFFDTMASEGLYTDNLPYRDAYTLQFVNKGHALDSKAP